MSTVTHDLAREAEAARSLLLNIRDVIGDDEEMIADAIEGETHLIETIAAADLRLMEIEALVEAIEAQQSALAGRKSRLKTQAERIKAAIVIAMSTAELKKAELPTGTISRRAVAPSVVETDLAEIPPRFWVQGDPKLDKRALLAALKEGPVPGAALSNGGETISIKRS